jgi:penicillin-binding protein 2
VASNGTVLAVDRCDADLAVHYRYFERPLDSAWLERMARARLSRKERRDPERVAQAGDEFRAEILAMWQSLSDLTGIDCDELELRAGRVQRRVDRIAQSVNRRRAERWAHERARADAEWTDAQRGQRNHDRSVPNDGSPAAIFHRFCTWLADQPPPPSNDTPPAAVSVVEQDRFYTLVENIPPRVLIEFTSNPERYPGVRLDQRIRRMYPQRELACSVVGYIEPGEEDDEAAGPPLNSGLGLTGVEGFYNDLLTGAPGHVREQAMLRGGLPRVLGGRPPRPGHDVTLTLDLRLQQFAEAALVKAQDRAPDPRSHTGRASSGAIVVLDVHTGAVLAAATVPRFDLNLAAAPSSEQYQQLMARSDGPLFNRIAQMTLAPGSTFKPVTAIAAIKEGLDPAETYYCRGFLHRPDKFRCLIYRNFGVGHETTSLHDALVRSCNVYFFQAAERLGADALVRWGEAFGFGQRTGIDLANELPGSLTDARVNAHSGLGRRAISPVRTTRPDTDALGLAIGQGAIEATPLQVAVMMAAIANDGLRVVPHVHRDAFQPPLPIAGIDRVRDRAIREIRQALEGVVADPRGTGHDEVFLPDIEIAGKTGTAQSGSPHGDHAWFAGYAPARKPRVAVVVALEHAGSGAHASGPLARDLIRHMSELGYFSDTEPMAANEPVIFGHGRTQSRF